MASSFWSFLCAQLSFDEKDFARKQSLVDGNNWLRLFSQSVLRIECDRLCVCVCFRALLLPAKVSVAEVTRGLGVYWARRRLIAKLGH